MNDSPSIWCINTIGETFPGLCYWSLRRWYGRFLSQLVAVWWGIITQSQNWSKNKASRKPPFLMGKDMVSCAFYLSQIHWSSQAFPPSMFVATAGWTDPSLGEIYGWTPTSCKTNWFPVFGSINSLESSMDLESRSSGSQCFQLHWEALQWFSRCSRDIRSPAFNWSKVGAARWLLLMLVESPQKAKWL